MASTTRSTRQVSWTPGMRHGDRIVIGSRLHDRTQFPLARYRANRFACFWISWASGHPIADSQSGFRIYPQEVMRIALERVRSSRFTFESEILIEAASNGVPYACGRHPGALPGKREAEPLSTGRRHHEDRPDGGRTPAASRDGAPRVVAQPWPRRGSPWPSVKHLTGPSMR